jgi:hypothetical protein
LNFFASAKKYPRLNDVSRAGKNRTENDLRPFSVRLDFLVLFYQEKRTIINLQEQKSTIKAMALVKIKC